MSFDSKDSPGSDAFGAAVTPEVLPPAGVAKRRQAIAELIGKLPGQFQAGLKELYRLTYTSTATDAERERSLFEELRRSLNLCVTDGLLARRQFLHITYLITSAGLLSALFPMSASAAGPMMPFAFWKQRTPSGSGASGYPVNTGSDPYWDYVVLLMNMDTAGGIPNTVFADESNTGKTPTIVGAPYIDTTASTSSPYSGRTGSVKFNNSSNAYNSNFILFAGTGSDFLLNGDFTIEFWAWVPSAYSTSDTYIRFLYTGNVPSSYTISINGINIRKMRSGLSNKIGISMYDSGGSTNFLNLNGSTDCPTNQWFHYAVSVSGATAKLFLNGNLDGTGTISGTRAWSENSVSIARTASTDASNGTPDFNGSLADLRIYNGVAKYTADFTPPTSPIGLGTANDKYWGYCVLACPFENSLKDMSGKRVTANGSAALNTTAKKYGTASASFNGTSDYITLADTDDFHFAGNHFIVEFFFRATNVTNYQLLLTHSTSYTGFEIAIQASKLNFSLGNGTSWWASATQLSQTLATDTWYHFALVRNGTALTAYLNGVQGYSGTSSEAVGNPSTTLCLGCYRATSNYFSGYIDSIRITKGYARYTSNFTPPTASFPVGKDETVDPFWTYTVLAMHMDDLTDATGRHFITNNGSVTNNTTTYKFGTASASFNGSNQYLTTANSTDYAFGTGDFTVECWINPSASSASEYRIWDSRDASYANGFGLAVNTNGLSAISDVEVSSTAPTLGQWTHVAVSRSGSTIRLFKDGALAATGTSSVNASNGTFNIGYANSGAGNRFNGYLDDLRITKGIARYTQNFTPPTRAFATTPLSTYTDYDPFWNQVVLLVTGNGTAGAATVADSGPNNISTNVGTGGTTISASRAKHRSTSVRTNNASTSYVLATHAGFSVGTGDFFVEFWLNWAQQSGYAYLAVSSQFYFFIHTNGQLTMQLNGTQVSDPSTISQNTWHHVAVGRASGTTYMFKNGAQVATSTISYTVNADIKFGAYMEGYFNDFRFTAGLCRSVSAFAPPRTAMPTSAGIVTSGLVALLDAGDAASYDGSSQAWKNLCTAPADSSSQSSYDFYRGSGSGSDGTDPTFAGIAGGRSANDYFSFDGGDYLTLASGANTSFLNSLHKDNAAFTIIVVAYVANASAWNNWVTNFSLGTDFGIAFQLTNTAKIKFAAYNGTASLEKVSDAAVSTGLHFVAVSLDEASTGFFYRNGGYEKVASAETWTAAYTGPSSTSASYSLKIGADGAAVVPLSNGSRVYLVQIYNRALTKAELDQNFAAMRSRFGI